MLNINFDIICIKLGKVPVQLNCCLVFYVLDNIVIGISIDSRHWYYPLITIVYDFKY